ncbi:exocyst complex component exo84 [Coccidioides immitis H538.4]|uniref:Exocyst complex component exo84 n=1 Tax=Coccidioides immitis H538.4 TaxID=396776 RepID=A0A0J8S179_COCIT|nr:exocyst complex component exo84 [Coccidioides immitis H538.4]
MDVRGLTLRSKSRRPQISAPKPIVDPNSGSSRSPGGLPSATPRPQRNGGATSDLVKRRYSAKFNQLPNFAVGEAPPVPSLPANMSRTCSQMPLSRTSESNKPAFAAQKTGLPPTFSRASTRTRTQFIKISKEAEKLKEEMSTLRGLMSELTTALGQAGATTVSSYRRSGKLSRGRRNSSPRFQGGISS